MYRRQFGWTYNLEPFCRNVEHGIGGPPKQFPHIPRQLFYIDNILINNLPLQVGPSVVEMCSKMELFMHLIPIFLCHLIEKIPISMIWVKVQSTRHCNDHDGVLVKVAKLNKCTPCCQFCTRSVSHSFCIWVHFLGCISNVVTCNVVGWKQHTNCLWNNIQHNTHRLCYTMKGMMH